MIESVSNVTQQLKLRVFSAVGGHRLYKNGFPVHEFSDCSTDKNNKKTRY